MTDKGHLDCEAPVQRDPLAPWRPGAPWQPREVALYRDYFERSQRNEAATFEALIGDLDDSRPGHWNSLATRLSFVRHGETHQVTLELLSKLARSLSADGLRRRAEDIYQWLWDFRCDALGSEHPSSLQALDELAHFHYLARDKSKALILYKRLLELRGKILGEDHPETRRAAYYHNMVRLHVLPGIE